MILKKPKSVMPDLLSAEHGIFDRHPENTKSIPGAYAS
jgi:hypothetical protein